MEAVLPRRPVKYKKRRKYKYTLYRPIAYQTDIIPKEPGKWGLLGIGKTGLLTIDAGYCWDGASGPAWDSLNFMRSSIIHDALYQLMREGKIGRHWRKRADQILREVCLQDGMARIRAWWVYRGVRLGSAKYVQSDIISTD